MPDCQEPGLRSQPGSGGLLFGRERDLFEIVLTTPALVGVNSVVLSWIQIERKANQHAGPLKDPGGDAIETVGESRMFSEESCVEPTCRRLMA